MMLSRSDPLMWVKGFSIGVLVGIIAASAVAGAAIMMVFHLL